MDFEPLEVEPALAVGLPEAFLFPRHTAKGEQRERRRPGLAPALRGVDDAPFDDTVERAFRRPG